MPGLTQAQLEERGATVGDYTVCPECSLFWSKRGFKQHTAACRKRQHAPQLEGPPEYASRPLSPADEAFLDFLAQKIVETMVDEHRDRLRRTR